MVGETKPRRGLAVICVVAVALCSATAGVAASGAQTSTAASDSVVSAPDVTVGPDEAAVVEVTLAEAPAGLAGFEIAVTVGNTSVAAISNMTVADAFTSPKGAQVASDGSSAMVKAADLQQNVQANATDVTLATVTLEGVEEGSTTLDVRPDNFDDDEGGQMNLSVDAGTVTVESSGGDTQTTGGSGAGFGLGLALAVLAGLGLAAGRRA